MAKVSWQTYEHWKSYGIVNGFHNLKPSDLPKSDKLLERSWYNKGSYKKWLFQFKFLNGITRKKERKPRNFFPNLSDGELINYIKENYYGKTLSEIYSVDSQAINEVKKRKLKEQLIDLEIIKKNKPDKLNKPVESKKTTLFSTMTNEELKNYVEENYKGYSVTELSRARNALYCTLLKKGLKDEFVREGLLTQKLKNNQNISRLSNEELRSLIREKYRGLSSTELSNNWNYLYILAINRGILEDLVNEGVITRRKKLPNGFYNEKSNDELMQIVIESHNGYSCNELQRNVNCLYRVLRERGILSILVDQGILTSKRDGPTNWIQLETMLENYLSGGKNDN